MPTPYAMLHPLIQSLEHMYELDARGDETERHKLKGQRNIHRYTYCRRNCDLGGIVSLGSITKTQSVSIRDTVLIGKGRLAKICMFYQLDLLT